MAAKTSPARRAAFLRALSATGNQTLACERAKVSRSWVQLHRRQDPAFRKAVEDAVAAATARLSGTGGTAPPSGWGWLDGEELLVRGGNGRKVQVARAKPDAFSPRVEARFLAVVAATCNVKAACTEIGMSPAAVYRHRARRTAFAELWDRAIETGYARLEAGLVERCNSLFSSEDFAPDLAIGLPTFADGLQLLRLYKHRIHKLGKPMRLGPEPSIEAVRAEVLRRVKAMERGSAVPEAEMARARRDWAKRRVG